MKLEPVYLVAPERPSLIPTRRAVLFAGLSFFGGAAAGGALGIHYERSKSGPANEELRPSGDPELDRLRRWAIEAPIEELYEGRLKLLTEIESAFPNDLVLWRGVVRLVDDVLEIARPQRRETARYLVALLRIAPQALASTLASRRSALEALTR